MAEELEIASHRGTYRVAFNCKAAEMLPQIRRDGDLVVCDRTVLECHPFLGESIGGRDELLTVNEKLKSYQGLEPVMHRVLEKGITKKSRIIAVGGGITQDCSAFMASVLYRGLDWIFFPTNLLAQCDSCIGSKTSINFGPYKNMLGGFYPPKQIYIDLNFLSTLPEAHLLSGLGEMLHYFMVTDWTDVDFFCAHFQEAASGNPQALNDLIQRSLAIKHQMIERDEFDQGPRNVFNFGHTFGHALESATDYAVPHGIAVSYGMDIAAVISTRRNLIPMTERNRMRRACALAASRNPLPDIDETAYFSALSKDKKNTGKGFSPILTRGVGDMFKTDIPLDDTVKQTILDYFGNDWINQDL